MKQHPFFAPNKPTNASNTNAHTAQPQALRPAAPLASTAPFRPRPGFVAPAARFPASLLSCRLHFPLPRPLPPASLLARAACVLGASVPALLPPAATWAQTETVLRNDAAGAASDAAIAVADAEAAGVLGGDGDGDGDEDSDAELGGGGGGGGGLYVWGFDDAMTNAIPLPSDTANDDNDDGGTEAEREARYANQVAISKLGAVTHIVLPPGRRGRAFAKGPTVTAFVAAARRKRDIEAARLPGQGGADSARLWVVGLEWLEACVREGRKVDEAPYSLL